MSKLKYNIEYFKTLAISKFANQIEKALQRRYSHLRKEGEWFDMSISNEVSFLDECKKMEKSLMFLKQKHNVFI